MIGYYTNNYYENRKKYINYMLDNGKIYTYGVLHPELEVHYTYNLSVHNSTINFTYVYNANKNTIAA